MAAELRGQRRPRCDFLSAVVCRRAFLSAKEIVEVSSVNSLWKIGQYATLKWMMTFRSRRSSSTLAPTRSPEGHLTAVIHEVGIVIILVGRVGISATIIDGV